MLIEGDCLDWLANLPTGCAQMVLCDLPYGTTRCAWDSPLPLAELWREYERVCTGPVLLFGQTPFDKVLGVSNLAALRYEWIWEKTAATGHLNANRAPLKAHENVLVFYSRAPTYNPIKTSGHVRKAAVRRVDSSPLYGAQRATTYDSTDRYPRSVVTFAGDKQREALHPTQKPVELCEYLIRTYTNEGETVLDNCMGSGTTGVAAARSGRQFIGIEKDPHYFGVAAGRIARAEG